MRKVNELISSEINLLYSIRKRVDLKSTDFTALLILSDALSTIHSNKNNISLNKQASIISNIIKLSKLITSTSQYRTTDYEHIDSNKYIALDDKTLLRFVSNGISFVAVAEYE